MAFEVDEVERCRRSGRTSPGLDAPGRGQPGARRQLEIRRRADKEGLAHKLLQSDAVVFPEIARLAADQDVGAYAKHRPQRGTYGGVLLSGPGRQDARPFRPVNQIEGRDRVVRDQVALQRQPELGLEIPYRGPGDIVDAAELAFDGECQPEGRAVPIQEFVAQINRNALPGQLPAVFEVWNGTNVVPGESATDLDPEIFYRHEFQL